MYVMGFEEGRSLCKIPEGKLMAAFASEFLGTFALAFVVLTAMYSKKTAGNSYYGIAVGGVLYGLVNLFDQFSGAAFNPALAVSSAFGKVMCWDYMYLYIISTFVGGAFAALIFRWLNPDDK
jgi:aquaporin Z